MVGGVGPRVYIMSRYVKKQGKSYGKRAPVTPQKQLAHIRHQDGTARRRVAGFSNTVVQPRGLATLAGTARPSAIQAGRLEKQVRPTSKSIYTRVLALRGGG